MKNLYLFFIVVLFSACHNKSPKSISHTNTKKQYKNNADTSFVAQNDQSVKKKEPIFTNELLKQYQGYTDTLNKDNIESSHIAAEKFLAMFSGSSQSICDSAYYIFDNYYLALGENVDSLIRLDTTIKTDSLLIRHPKQILSTKLLTLKEQLARNGYMVYISEGDAYIGLDEDFVAKWFYSKVSPELKTYLIQENKENKKVPTEDAGIIISPEEFVNRLVWWEKFNQEHKDFIFANASYSNEYFYLVTLLSGIDNTYLIEKEGSKISITDFYKEAAAYLKKKYPSSPSAIIIPQYYQAISNGKRAMARELLWPYVKTGVLRPKDIENIIKPDNN